MTPSGVRVSVEKIDVSNEKAYDCHEQMFKVKEPVSGLEGYIAIHNTNCGPAIGGTRYARYDNSEGALEDALRLSRAMTYKCAIANLPYGGGKSVLIAHSPEKSTDYLSAYAVALDALGVDFFTGEDVGVTQKDIEYLEKISNRIVGRPNVGGMPGEWAAHGVMRAIETGLEELTGSSSLRGRRVAVRGVGQVGSSLVSRLVDKGASVIIADIDHSRATSIQKIYPSVVVVSPDEIMRQQVDVYAPCALGDEFSITSIPQLSCTMVCGGANNQLAFPEAGKLLFERKITYIPDYAANAGGLISVVDELNVGGYSKERVMTRIEDVQNTIREIIRTSREQKVPTNLIADRIAESRFKS